MHIEQQTVNEVVYCNHVWRRVIFPAMYTLTSGQLPLHRQIILQLAALSLMVMVASPLFWQLEIDCACISSCCAMLQKLGYMSDMFAHGGCRLARCT